MLAAELNISRVRADENPGVQGMSKVSRRVWVGLGQRMCDDPESPRYHMGYVVGITWGAWVSHGGCGCHMGSVVGSPVTTESML